MYGLPVAEGNIRHVNKSAKHAVGHLKPMDGKDLNLFNPCHA